VVKLQESRSNPQWANQLTVKHAFQNADLGSQKMSHEQIVSTRNKLGRDKDEASK